MGETIKIFSFNLLETGIVGVTGTPDTGYPEERLWDRCGHLYWRVTGEASYIFQIEQVGQDDFGYDDDFGFSDGFGYDNALKTVDLLYIVGHNFIGHTCYWQYSDEGISWVTQETWTQTDNDPIAKTIVTAESHKYWRFKVIGMANPICGELYLSSGYSFGVQASPAPVHGYDANVVWTRGIGGFLRSVKYGEKKAVRQYMLRLDSSDLTDFDTIVSDLDDFSKPCVIKDKDGSYYMMKLEIIPDKGYKHARTEVDLSLMEV